jgi:hypothetical protein
VLLEAPAERDEYDLGNVRRARDANESGSAQASAALVNDSMASSMRSAAGRAPPPIRSGGFRSVLDRRESRRNADQTANLRDTVDPSTKDTRRSSTVRERPSARNSRVVPGSSLPVFDAFCNDILILGIAMGMHDAFFFSSATGENPDEIESGH